jgi:hypothetical protein
MRSRPCRAGAAPGPVDRRLEQRPGTTNGPVHRIVGRVAAPDLADAVVQRHWLAGWPGGHVGEGERVHERPSSTGKAASSSTKPRSSASKRAPE